MVGRQPATSQSKTQKSKSLSRADFSVVSHPRRFFLESSVSLERIDLTAMDRRLHQQPSNKEPQAFALFGFHFDEFDSDSRARDVPNDRFASEGL
jgi:hypothetical protein